MVDENDIAKGFIKSSIGYMMFSAIVGIVLGLVMLLYPGGTMALMQAAFMIFQIIITIFVVYYSVSEAIRYFKSSKTIAGVFYIIIGIIVTILIWVLNVSLIYYLIAFFLVLTGIGDIFGGMRLPGARFFLIFLGVVNILIAVIILRHPIVLPLLIAWYVLFWGISRLFLSFELRKLMK